MFLCVVFYSFLTFYKLIFHSLALSAEFLCCWSLEKMQLVFCVICVTFVNLKLWESYCPLIKFLTMHFCSHLIMGSVHWIPKNCCKLNCCYASNAVCLLKEKAIISHCVTEIPNPEVIFLKYFCIFKLFLYAVIFQVPLNF